MDGGAVALLPPEAALLLRFAGDPAEAARRLEPWYPPEVKKAFAAQRLDPVTGLAPAFGPGGALSLALAPTFTLTDFSSPRFDLRRVRPLLLRPPRRGRSRCATPRCCAPSWPGCRRPAPASPSRWSRADRPPSPPAGRSPGARRSSASRSPAGGSSSPAGRRAWPRWRPGPAAGQGYAAPGPAARAALSSGLGGAVLDVEHLARSVEALPEEAYGTGPNAVVMRSLVNRYLEPATRRSPPSRCGSSSSPGAALVDLDVDGRSEPKPRP